MSFPGYHVLSIGMPIVARANLIHPWESCRG